MFLDGVINGLDNGQCQQPVFGFTIQQRTGRGYQGRLFVALEGSQDIGALGCMLDSANRITFQRSRLYESGDIVSFRCAMEKVYLTSWA
jgi:hypothetical protein